jgi:hypothetical protein
MDSPNAPQVYQPHKVQLADIEQLLRNVLTTYKQLVGCGLLTRSSRKKIVADLQNALDALNETKSGVQREQHVQVMLKNVLSFAKTMHSTKQDVGYLGQSRLHSLLWGNHFKNHTGGVYQRLYDFFLHNKKGPELLGKILAELKKVPVAVVKKSEPQAVLLEELPYSFLPDLDDGKAESEAEEAKATQSEKTDHDSELRGLIGYNWARNHSLRRT